MRLKSTECARTSVWLTGWLVSVKRRAVFVCTTTCLSNWLVRQYCPLPSGVQLHSDTPFILMFLKHAEPEGWIKKKKSNLIN